MRLADVFSYDAESDIRRSGRPETYLFFAAAFTAILFLTHSGFLSTPYFWDEAGHFVPTALDLYREGRWTPVTTTPSVHPPLIAALLAALWQVTGPSIEATRSLMLIIAACGLLGAFLLAIELSRHIAGSPAFLAVLFLLASPLFFTQAMMVQLDMPAMALTVWSLFLFLRGRLVLCIVTCTLLTLTKETGAIVPLILGLWSAGERRLRVAAWFLVPLCALFGWVSYLHAATGEWLGDSEFARFNVVYPLHPARLLAAVTRRVVFLLFENFHWIGTLCVTAGFRLGFYDSRGWRLAIVVMAAHIAAVSVFGGAILDRYLLPVLPIFYTAAAVGLSALKAAPRLAGAALLMAGLFGSLFWNPPLWSVPLENSLSMVYFAEVHKRAAQFLETHLANRRIVTAWPMSIELMRPELGYVTQALPQVYELPDFRVSSVLGSKPEPEVLVLYSRDVQPRATIFREPLLKAFAERYLRMYTPTDGPAIERRYLLHRIMRFEDQDQWVEVYGR